MANIALLNRCNLKCKYCFADNYTGKEREDITLETFNKLLSFASQDREVGIIGGEPLLHKNIDTFLDILKNDMRFVRATIFTNGVYIDKHLPSLIHPKFIVLVNVNSPKDIGKSAFDKLDENIELLIENGMKRNVTLGINVYEENQDFTDFLYLVRKYTFNKIRVSVVIPSEKSEGGIDYFYKMKPTLFKLYKELKELGVSPCYDCNAIPECVYTNEEKAFLETLPFANDYERAIFMGERSVCSPVIDLYPDLTATRCFGCYDDLKVDIKDFKSLSDLSNFFFKEIDAKRVHTLSRPECMDCYDYKTFKCYGGCLCY
jgi:sulfatase maturation enzyme AslB (radical SAM superfamily)